MKGFVPDNLESLSSKQFRAIVGRNKIVTSITHSNTEFAKLRLSCRIIRCDMKQQITILQLAPIKTLQSLHAKFRIINESFETNLDCNKITRE